MGWTARQQALLQAMGLRLWQRPPAVADEALPATPAASGPSATGKPAALQARSPSPVLGAGAALAVAADAPAATAAPAAAAAAPPRSPLAHARGELAALGWTELRQAVAACTACGLCQSRTQPVFGSAAESAHWMVVGEAPGEQEDPQGLPFVGPSGELLDAMLSALHLTRAGSSDGRSHTPPEKQVFIANTVKCRPPKNRNPTAEELAACEPFLLRQIELLQPRIILALGAFATKALLRSDEPVGKLRGRVHRYRGVPVVVSYHPAYLLRQPLEKARAWEDLCLAADTAESAEGVHPGPAAAHGA